MKKTREKRSARSAEGRVALPTPHWQILAGLFAVCLACHWTPLFSADASIQWDAVDVHYSSQKYLADRLWSGSLPHWTPYIFSGFPFLADPQVGAWYPLNWPFFLLGITPKAIQWELFLHAFGACAGAYFLALTLVENRLAAAAGALAYGLGGFFAAHSSHVGMFQTAAWLPWVLLGFRRAPVLAGLAGGVMVLVGHFQTSLYVFSAVALAAAAEVAADRAAWKNMLRNLALTAAVAALVSSACTLPGLELARASIRADLDTSASAEGSLPLSALATLVSPDALGALGDNYQGPADVTQYYFYSGILTLPLALAGWRQKRARVLGLMLAVPALAYALGPAFGFYRVISWLPGFRSVRAPVHAWFVVALGIALLAAAGVEWLSARFRGVSLVVVLILAADLFYWNSARNPLAYARNSFQMLYGAQEEKVAANIGATLKPLTRFHAPKALPSFGSLNHPLDLKLEATYGYNPLELQAYADYVNATGANPRLLDTLSVSRRLELNPPSVQENPRALPRAVFPREVLAGPARDKLANLDPAAAAISEEPWSGKQDPAATAEVVGYEEQALRIRCKTASESLLRVSLPYFPGWRATAGGAELAVRRVDHALTGVIVPPGDHVVELRFHPAWFLPGLILSLAGILGAILCRRLGV